MTSLRKGRGYVSSSVEIQTQDCFAVRQYKDVGRSVFVPHENVLLNISSFH